MDSLFVGVCYNYRMKESLKTFCECLLKDPSVKGGKSFLDIWKPFSKKYEIDFGPEDVISQLRALQSVNSVFDKDWDPNWGIYLMAQEGSSKKYEVFRVLGGSKRDSKTFNGLEEALNYKIELILDEVSSSLDSLRRM